VKERHRILLVTRRETGLEVNEEKMKYTVVSCEQNAGLHYNMAQFI